MTTGLEGRSFIFTPGTMTFGALLITALILLGSLISYAMSLNSDIVKIDSKVDNLENSICGLEDDMDTISRDVRTNSGAIERIDVNLEYIKNYIENELEE